MKLVSKKMGVIGAATMLASVFVFGCGDDSSTSTADAGGGTPVELGEAAVKKYDCAECHAAKDGTLSGQTTPRPGTHAYPQNLTPDMDTGLGEWSEDLLVTAIMTGVDDEGEELCTTMPRFKDLGMKEAEARNIAAYLKSLDPVKNAIPESSCPPIKGGESDAGTDAGGETADDAGAADGG